MTFQQDDVRRFKKLAMSSFLNDSCPTKRFQSTTDLVSLFCLQWGAAEGMWPTEQQLLHHAAMENARDGVGATEEHVMVQKVRGQYAGKIRWHDTAVCNVASGFETKRKRKRGR